MRSIDVYDHAGPLTNGVRKPWVQLSKRRAHCILSSAQALATPGNRTASLDSRATTKTTSAIAIVGCRATSHTSVRPAPLLMLERRGSIEEAGSTGAATTAARRGEASSSLGMVTLSIGELPSS